MKTLDELRGWGCKCTERIRKSAIEDIKVMEGITTFPCIPKNDKEREYEKFLSETDGFDPVIEYIKKKFNIKESDLK